MTSNFLTQIMNTMVARGIDAAFNPQDELTLTVPAAKWLAVAESLRDNPEWQFAQLMDVCGVDYQTYGHAQWVTDKATSSGFDRGVAQDIADDEPHHQWPARFSAVYHLLSLTYNARLRVRVFAVGDPPVVPSMTTIWPSASWFEREAFDLIGIIFEGHEDLRRILTDYGFIGHPFRKDFPLSGEVEVRYDKKEGRVIHEPVSIEPRILVPRVIRHQEKSHG